MAEENIEIMRLAAEALNNRDADAFRVLLTEDAEIVPLRAALEGTVYRGPDAATEFFADMQEAWEMLSIGDLDIRDGGDWILAIGRLRGRGRGTGAEFEMKMGYVARLREGKIKGFRTYADPTAALEAVGLRE